MMIIYFSSWMGAALFVCIGDMQTLSRQYIHPQLANPTSQYPPPSNPAVYVPRPAQKRPDF